MLSSPRRSVMGAVVVALVTVSMTGLPLPRHADHGDDIAHVEHDHGGHGAVLLQQDERLLSKALDVPAGTTTRAQPPSGPVICAKASGAGASSEHHGRDPPPATQPRAPPS